MGLWEFIRTRSWRVYFVILTISIPSTLIIETWLMHIKLLPGVGEEDYNSNSMSPFRVVAEHVGWDIIQGGSKKNEIVLKDEPFQPDEPNEPEPPGEETW